MPKCEKCQISEAHVRLDAIVNGQRESHVFCQPCAEEVMRGAMGGGIPAGSGKRETLPQRREGDGNSTTRRLSLVKNRSNGGIR